MKKIVGIIAAVAMAASVFAVEFSAGARIEGDLFSYDGNSKTITLLSSKVNNQDYHKPFNFSVSGDRAGATVKISEKSLTSIISGVAVTHDAITGDPVVATTADNKGLYEYTTYNIWFKPFDAVKVEFGNVSLAMHTETMGWYRRILNYDAWGFKAAATFGAATVTVGLVPGSQGAAWFTKANGVDAAIAETNLAFEYNADFGNIMAMADFSDSFDTIKFAAGYKGSFGAVSFFADYMFTKAATNKNNITADVKYAQDAITFEAYTNIGLAANTSVQLVSRFSYAFDSLNTYLEFDCGDLLADPFDAGITGSVSGNLGAMAWEVQAKYGIKSKTFSVPFNVAVSF